MGSAVFSRWLGLPLLADCVPLASSPCGALGDDDCTVEAGSSVLAACVFDCNPVTRRQSLFGSRTVSFTADTCIDVLAMMVVVEVGGFLTVEGSSYWAQKQCPFAVIAFVHC